MNINGVNNQLSIINSGFKANQELVYQTDKNERKFSIYYANNGQPNKEVEKGSLIYLRVANFITNSIHLGTGQSLAYLNQIHSSLKNKIKHLQTETDGILNFFRYLFKGLIGKRRELQEEQYQLRSLKKIIEQAKDQLSNKIQNTPTADPVPVICQAPSNKPWFARRPFFKRKKVADIQDQSKKKKKTTHPFSSTQLPAQIKEAITGQSKKEQGKSAPFPSVQSVAIKEKQAPKEQPKKEQEKTVHFILPTQPTIKKEEPNKEPNPNKIAPPPEKSIEPQASVDVQTVTVSTPNQLPPPPPSVPPPPGLNGFPNLAKPKIVTLLNEPKALPYVFNNYKEIQGKKIQKEELEKQIHEVETYVKELDQAIKPVQDWVDEYKKLEAQIEEQKKKLAPIEAEITRQQKQETILQDAIEKNKIVQFTRATKELGTKNSKKVTPIPFYPKNAFDNVNEAAKSLDLPVLSPLFSAEYALASVSNLIADLKKESTYESGILDELNLKKKSLETNSPIKNNSPSEIEKILKNKTTLCNNWKRGLRGRKEFLKNGLVDKAIGFKSKNDANQQDELEKNKKKLFEKHPEAEHTFALGILNLAVWSKNPSSLFKSTEAHQSSQPTEAMEESRP